MISVMVLMWLLVIACVAATQQSLGQTTGQALTEAEHLEEAARTFLQELDDLGSQACKEVKLADWNYQSDITDKHKQKRLAAQLKYAKWQRKAWERVRKWNGKWETLSDPFLKRQFKLMSILGTAALPKDELEEHNRLQEEMMSIYSTAKICDFIDPKNCQLSLDPDLGRILRKSRNYEELEHVWKMWRDNSGRRLRQHYKRSVTLANKAAALNGFGNMGEMWLYPYESETFRDDVAELWEQLKPLYQQLHAYVRRKLREEYGEDKVTRGGPIPAHMLGNMWAQSWSDVYHMTIPFPDKASIDVTPEMEMQGYTPRGMFELSEEFFVSLNLSRMPTEFWENSIIQKPEGRELVCHASAWDFCNGKDYRIMECTDMTLDDLRMVHHEMGHVQYFLQYKHLPKVFRAGANPGFHEAVGDVLALSASTPKHLHKIGLLENLEDDPKADINFLLEMALSKVAFLPFGYLIDLWRWDVFSGQIPEDRWNCAWWDLRYRLQGIKPPVQRSEDDFDPGAKYHIATNSPYIRFFVAFVLQFQFHKTLCLKAGEYDPLDPTKPLHKCDIYQSTEAGNAFGDMLQLGSSKPWPEALEALTGGRKMDASVVREYFRPLEEWLTQDNQQHGEVIGWQTDEVFCLPESAAKRAKSHQSTDAAAAVAVPWAGLLLLFLLPLLVTFLVSPAPPAYTPHHLRL